MHKKEKDEDWDEDEKLLPLQYCLGRNSLSKSPALTPSLATRNETAPTESRGQSSQLGSTPAGPRARV